MAKSTFLQLCQDTRRECGVAGAGPTNVAGQSGILEKVVRWVQYSDMEIQGRWNDWRFMHRADWKIDTVASQAIVYAPDDLGGWDDDSFFINHEQPTYWKLSPVGYQDYRNIHRQGPQISNKPVFVSVMPDNNLVLIPPPSTTYSLSADYWRKPKKLVNNTDTSYIPEEYERIIITRAALLFAGDNGSIDMIASFQVEYDDILDKLEAKYLPGQAARRLSSAPSMVVRPQ